MHRYPMSTHSIRPSPWRAMFAAALLALALAGCGLLPEVKDETAGWSADRLYQTAHDAMLQGNYIRATKLFDQLEARYPYGRYAQQAILESAFANWRGNETAAAIAAADRFIRTYPNHPNVDYAYYLKGLVHFREDQGILGYVYELDLSERDPEGNARVVRRVQGTDGALPGQPVLPGLGRADALPEQRDGDATRSTSPITTTGAAPTSRPPTARRRRC